MVLQHSLEYGLDVIPELAHRQYISREGGAWFLSPENPFKTFMFLNLTNKRLRFKGVFQPEAFITYLGHR